ncbi:MAG TPA: tetraacyldisaccharide 4'-kinase [Rhizomicrobium sp.]|nr:tetraacyldisaccharide 4'-kinase [Rhizomicrobium sp.]
MRAPDFWNRRGPLALLLAPLGTLYGMSVARKARRAKPYRSTARVICVGNLTAGGSGKTPAALAVAQMLIGRGKKVFFLTRGYGGSETGPLLVSGQDATSVGDEALLLARVAPTIVARDRAAGARLAAANGAEVIVMDDGHQNFSLAKDVSLVVADGFGNGLMIPAGPLREPLSQGLARADAVIAMNDARIDGFTGPVLRTWLEAEGASFTGRRVFAFAGIGQPGKFVKSLQGAGAIVTGNRFFADHHPYTASEIAGLRKEAGDAALVTTEKDFVRLAPEQRKGIETLAVCARFDEPHLLDRLIGAV